MPFEGLNTPSSSLALLQRPRTIEGRIESNSPVVEWLNKGLVDVWSPRSSVSAPLSSCSVRTDAPPTSARQSKPGAAKSDPSAGKAITCKGGQEGVRRGSGGGQEGVSTDAPATSARQSKPGL
eukprot:1180517-Prorocentrum_minimum.AAC.1